MDVDQPAVNTDGRDREPYERTWQALNNRDLAVEERDLVSTLGQIDTDVERFFLRAPDCRFFILDTLSAEDRAALARSGLRPAVLRMNLEQTIVKNGRSNWDRRRFQIDAVKERRLYASCPFSGKLLVSRTSLPVTRDVVFYRFVGSEVFYVITNHIGAGFTKGALYFPARNIVVKAIDFIWELRQEHITKFKTLMVSNAASVARYCARESKRDRVAICFGDANYAHHLWNELSGLLRLDHARCLTRVDRFFVYREPLGPITRSFPSVDASKIRFLAAGGDIRAYIAPQMFGEILDADLFLVNVGDEYISQRLVRRVRRNFDLISQDRVNAIRAAKRDRWPLVLISIRTENRTWIGQATGLCTVLRQLAKTYPRLGVVIDGYSLAVDYDHESALHPWLRVSEQEAKILSAEDALAREITAGLADTSIACFPTVGHSLIESALWVSKVDFYITHAGSNQHKVGWLGNKPGIVHSNSDILRRKPSYYFTVREFGIPPTFLDPHSVHDIAGSNDEPSTDLRATLGNYVVDVPRLSAAVEKLAHEVALRKRGMRAVTFWFARLLRDAYRCGFAHETRRRLRHGSVGAVRRVLKKRLSSRSQSHDRAIR